MSTVVDQRVVEMRFDNRHFEKNTAATMSTLDKLKQKLNFGGVSKGLEQIDTKSVTSNMTGLGRAVDTVSARFSALQVMGVTALANITNSAVNAGKRIVSALTIDPIKTGFQEYETQINATQTILANVSQKGKTLDDVNAALEELNTYADKTIYNFTEMTKNIGLFTNAGIGLDESVASIKGFSNAAAMAGADSTRTSQAMYQLSQAMSAGVVKLLDWRSLSTANIAGERFQDTIKITAKAHGIAVDEMIAKEGNLQNTLHTGWLTADLMAEALNHYTLSTEEMTEAEIEANRAKLKSIGYTDEQIDKLFQLGTEATNAATKVKTFTQLWDVMKESAQSGWAQTWKIIIGDFEEAKALLTPLSEFFTGIIGRISDARNNLLDSALSRKLTRVFDNVNSVLTTTQTNVEKIIQPLKDLDGMVNKIMNGELGNGEARWNALTEAGYNWCEVQNKVNETMGDSFRYTEEQIAEQNKLLGVSKEVSETTGEQVESTTELTDASKKQLKVLAKLSDEQLKSRGYTDEQIAALDELRRTAEMLGMPIEEFIDNLDQINGRFILIQGFKNIGQGLIDIFTEIKAAWQEVFPPKSIEERSEKIFNLITSFAEFTSKLRLTDEDAENLRKTFKGLFAVIDIITTVVGGGFKLAFELLQAVLGYFNMDILEFTALIGDGLVKFRDFIDSTLDFSGAIEKIAPYVKDAAEAIREWIDGLKETNNIPKYIIDGLVNGLKTGVSAVWEGAVSLAKSLYDAFCEFFGIESPSKLMIAAGGFIILGLIVGLTQGFDKLGDTGIEVANGLFESIEGVLLNLFDWLKNIDFGSILSVAAIGGVLFVINKIADALKGAVDIVGGIGDIFEGVGDTLIGFGRKLKAEAFDKTAEGVLKLVLAVVVLVGALYLMTKIDWSPVLPALGVLAAVVGMIALLAVAVNKMGMMASIKMALIGGIILNVGLVLLMMAAVAKIISGIDDVDAFNRGVNAVIAFGLVIEVLLITISKMPTTAIKGVGSSILAVGAAMLMMAWVAKIIAGMEWYEMARAGAGIGAFALIIVGLLAATRLAGGGEEIAKVGSVIFSVSVAMLLMAVVAKIIAGMTWDEMGKAGAGIAAFGLIITGLIWATKLAGDKIKSAGAMIAAVGAAMFLLALTAKIIAGMEWSEMAKAGVGIVALGGIIVGLIAATKLAGEGELKRVGLTLLLMSVSIGILGLIAALLGAMKLENLAKGVAAVSILGLIMAAMVAATRGASDCKGNLIVMTVAIGVMAMAVAALSFIDPEKLKGPVIAMGILMGMFAVMTAASKLATGSMGALIAMTVAMGLMAGILYRLSDLPVESTIGNAIAIGVLMLALSASLAVLSLMGSSIGWSLVGVIALITLWAPLSLFIGLLGKMEGLTNAEQNTEILIALTTTMSLLLLVLAGVGALALFALTGVVLLCAMWAPLSIFIGLLGKMEKLTNAEENVEILIGLMTTLMDVLTKLAIIGPFAVIGVAALTGLGLLMAGFGTVAYAIGEFGGSDLGEKIDSGMAVLEKLAHGLGSVIGSFITGFSERVMTLLPKLGTSLSQFMMNAMPFIIGAKMIDDSMLSGVKALAETVLILTAVDIIEGLTSWLTGGNSLASFGEQLPQLGADLSSFASSLGTFDDTTVATVTCAANAIKALAEAAESLPNEGGWAAVICGDNRIETFGGYLPGLGTNLSGFATNLGTFDDAKVATVTCAANAIKAIADVAKDLPNEGGWWGKICGDNSIETFGGYLPGLGTNLSGFATNLGTFDDAKVATVTCAANAIKAIADVAKGLPNEGGWIAKLCGDNSIETFGGYLPGLATNLSDFAGNLGMFDEAKVTTVDAAVRAIRALATLADSDLSGAKKHLSGFGDKLVDLGADLSDFCDDVSGVEGIDTAIDNLNTLLDSVAAVGNTDTGPLSTLGKSLKTVGDGAIDDFVSALSSETAKTDVETAAADLGDKIISGLKSKKESIKIALAEMATYASGKIKTWDNREKFRTAGAYLAEGLAAGISSKIDEIAAKAAELVTAAINAANEAADSRSPSREFYKVGEYCGMGFVNALGDYSPFAYDAAYNMADSARSGLSDTIARIASIFDSDMDIQPTIRPVLDLSDVRSGASAIETMLGINRSVGVMANVGAISTTMNRNRQNGTNDDVVSAIDELGKRLDNVGNTYNSINGISYSDGDVADAIKTIVRAARVERRT